MMIKAWAILATLGVSFVPGLELRLGIPVGMALGLSTRWAVVTAILGNLLQIQLAVLVVAFGYRYCLRSPRVKVWLEKTEAQVGRHGGMIRRWGWLGLAAFVLLPLPGTGVWGGVVVARLLGLQPLALWSGLSLGVALSGLLIGAGAHGLRSLISSLF
jgi:uncharacterized membrane protein